MKHFPSSRFHFKNSLPSTPNLALLEQTCVVSFRLYRAIYLHNEGITGDWSLMFLWNQTLPSGKTRRTLNEPSWKENFTNLKVSLLALWRFATSEIPRTNKLVQAKIEDDLSSLWVQKLLRDSTTSKCVKWRSRQSFSSNILKSSLNEAVQPNCVWRRWCCCLHNFTYSVGKTFANWQKYLVFDLLRPSAIPCVFPHLDIFWWSR